MPVLAVDPVNARKTYNYLRLGLFGSSIFLGVSVIWEYRATARVLGDACWQESISAYYYTPARAVFVGVLVAMGFALIVIKGVSWEDLALNIAGLLAPIVAFVPTINANLKCYSVMPDPLPFVVKKPPPDPPVFEDWVIRFVDNNMGSYLWVMLAGVFFAAILYTVGSNTDTTSGRRGWFLLGADIGDPGRRAQARATEVSILGLAGIIAIGLIWREGPRFPYDAHNFAAIAMFVAVAAAAVVNWYRDRETEPWWARGYLAVALLMALAAFLIMVPLKEATGGYHVIWLEAVEIALFSIYWLLQTINHWNDPVPGGVT